MGLRTQRRAVRGPGRHRALQRRLADRPAASSPPGTADREPSPRLSQRKRALKEAVCVSCPTCLPQWWALTGSGSAEPAVEAIREVEEPGDIARVNGCGRPKGVSRAPTSSARVQAPPPSPTHTGHARHRPAQAPPPSQPGLTVISSLGCLGSPGLLGSVVGPEGLGSPSQPPSSPLPSGALPRLPCSHSPLG